MAPKFQRQTVTLEDATLPRFLRNFEGKEDQYNRKGNRNFGVFLTPEVADAMRADGWNVKELKAREEGDVPQAYLPVAVNFNGPRPPRIVMITSNGRNQLPEDQLDVLDYAQIRTADLIVTPYEWEVNGNSGVKAYLQTLFVTIEEDELEQKYGMNESDDDNRGPRFE